MVTRIKAEDFVKAWQVAKSVDEVAAKVGLHKSACYARARYYRSKGVPLKKFKTGPRIDWDALTELAESLEEKDEQS